MLRIYKGFTIIEIMLSVVVLVSLLVGLMGIYIYCFELQETANNTTIALNQARAKLEEIRNSGFDSIITNYNNKTWPLSALDGRMRTEATSVVTGSLIDIRVVVCWRQKGGRIIGSATFDANRNFTNCTNSPVELVTSLSKRQ